MWSPWLFEFINDEDFRGVLARRWYAHRVRSIRRAQRRLA